MLEGSDAYTLDSLWNLYMEAHEKIVELSGFEHVTLKGLDNVGRGERWKQAVFRKAQA